MNTTTPIWESEPIHIDRCVCVDVKAHPGSVTLGQLHGENHAFASDTNMAPEQAYAVADALLEAADKALRS
jgi:hypothetical protein